MKAPISASSEAVDSCLCLRPKLPEGMENIDPKLSESGCRQSKSYLSDRTTDILNRSPENADEHWVPIKSALFYGQAKCQSWDILDNQRFRKRRKVKVPIAWTNMTRLSSSTTANLRKQRAFYSTPAFNGVFQIY